MVVRGALQRLLRRYGWALLAPLATLSFSVGTNALASRVLGADGFGEFAVGVTTLTLLGISFGLGMPSALLRFRAAASVRGEPGPTAQQALTWPVVLAASAIISAMFLSLATWRAEWISSWVPQGAAPSLVLAALGVALMELRSAEAQADARFDRYFGAVVGNSGFRLLGVATAFLLGGRSAHAALLGYAIASLIGNGALSARPIRAAVRALSVPAAELRSAVTRLVAFGTPILATTLLISAVTSIDTLVAAALLPRGDLGIYAAGIRLTVVQSTIIAGLTAIAAPEANRAIAHGDVRDYLKRWTLVGAAGGLLATGFLLTFAGEAVGVVYGGEFGSSASVFRIVSLGMLPNFAANLLCQLLYASGRARSMLISHGLQLLALVVVLPAVAPVHGVVGLSVARAVINTCTVALVLYFCLRIPRIERHAA